MKYILTVSYDDADEAGYGIVFLTEAIDQAGGYVTGTEVSDEDVED